MRLVFGFVLILGLGLAGFAVYMAQDFIAQNQAELDAERASRVSNVPTKPVFVATRVVRYGERLAKDDVREVAWPEDAIPEGTFQSFEDLFPNGESEPRSVLRSMEKDEAILAVKVTDPGEDAGVSSRLSKGMRAFAIRVDVTSGVSGFLRPGDRVDVYWSGSTTNQSSSDRRARREEITKLIETNVRLIAIDQSADEDRSSPAVARTVTVEITPDQVASLAQAQSTGRLSLSLVGAEDDTEAAAVEVDQNKLLGIVEKEEIIVEAEKERICTIRTRKGAEVVEIPIPCTN